MNLKGKRVLLTGASSGIGLELARVLAGRGCCLALASRRCDRLEEISEELVTACPGLPRPMPVACDVRDTSAVRNFIGACVETLGAVDVLINNAGICVYGDADRTPVEDYEQLLEVNYLGPVRAMLEVLPFMKRQGHGLIVNVTTLAAVHGVPYLGPYGASKSALVTLSQAMRAELAESGVRVMVVYPDYTESEIFENEKRVGGARRPEGPYAPTRDVAERIVRAIEADRDELMLSARGKQMAVLTGLAPGLVNRAMRRLAAELREDED